MAHKSSHFLQFVLVPSDVYNKQATNLHVFNVKEAAK